MAPVPTDRSMFVTEMVPVLAAMASVLQARLLLMLAVIGAFALTFLIVGNPDQMKILTVAIYDICIVGPLVFLYVRKA
jgi:hypothetical protein